MANKFLSGINVTGTATLNTVVNAGTNTDKFLVLDASGNVDFRTALELYNDLGIGSLPAGFTSTVKHQVKAGEAINKGQAVYVTSADGTNMIVSKASNASEATSSKTMGLIESNLSQNGQGVVITEGLLAGLNTTGATNAGDPVWLGTDGNLIYGLTNKPYAPAHLVFIGIVTRINANNGEIFVKVQNGFELREIHDVDLITTTPINGHILGYNGTLWVNKTIAGWLGYTPVTNARTLTINGTSYDLSADRSWTINSMVYPSAGIAVSTGTAWGTSITDNSSNWNTAFGWGNHASAGYVPGARTLTINGTAFDLTANRSWTIDSTTAATRTIQKFTSTSGQTTFTVTGGYTVGMVDVYVNGVKLDNAVDFTASNGTTVVLTDALIANQIVEVYKFGSQFIPNNALRQVTLFTATAGQTTFTVNYSVGFVDVFYNGSKLDTTEFTASNGTSIVFATACQLNDKVEVVAYSYIVGAFTGVGGSGTTNYISKWTASGTLNNSVLFDNGTNIGLGTTSPNIGGYGANSRLLTIQGVSGSYGILELTSNSANADGSAIGRLDFGSDGQAAGYKAISSIASFLSGSTSTKFGADLRFYTRPNNAGTGDPVERMRITRDGNIGIGSSSPADYFSRTLTIDGSSSQGIMFRASGTDRGYVYQDGSFIQLGSNAGGVIFKSNDTERMRITSSGNVGIGTSSPNGQLDVYASGTDLNTYFSQASAGNNNFTRWTRASGPTLIAGVVRNSNDGNQKANTAFMGTTNAYDYLFYTNDLERMRITSGGNVLIGTTSDVGQRLRIYQPTNGNWNIKMIQPNSSSINFQEFLTTTDGDATNTARGSITYNGTNVLFNGTSDYRLKEDLKDYNGLNIISELKTYDFKWIEANKRDYGMMAHELQQVLPNYVTGEKDAVNEDGSIKPQGVDYSKLVPILIKAIQELKAEVEQLKQK